MPKVLRILLRILGYALLGVALAVAGVAVMWAGLAGAIGLAQLLGPLADPKSFFWAWV